MESARRACPAEGSRLKASTVCTSASHTSAAGVSAFLTANSQKLEAPPDRTAPSHTTPAAERLFRSMLKAQGARPRAGDSAHQHPFYGKAAGPQLFFSKCSRPITFSAASGGRWVAP